MSKIQFETFASQAQIPEDTCIRTGQNGSMEFQEMNPGREKCDFGFDFGCASSATRLALI